MAGHSKPLLTLLATVVLAGCMRLKGDPNNIMTASFSCDTAPVKAFDKIARVPSPVIVEGFGNVVGSVVQSGGGALASARVRLSQPRNGYRLALPEHSSDSSGGFQIDSVMPGKYRISVRRLGFAQDSSELVVASSRVATVRFQLRAYRCTGY